MHDYDFLLIEKPVQTSLGDCLTLLSKYQLEEIANHHKIQNPSKIKKAEFASISLKTCKVSLS